MGAYLGVVTAGIPILGAFMYNAIYKFPAYRFECNNVFTNTTPTGAYRGAGRPEATFAIERLMDELAAELNMDPIELREEELDQARGVPVHHRRRARIRHRQLRGGHRKGAREMFGYDTLRAEQKARRESGDRVQLGIGVSTYTEMCGLAPSRVLGSLDYAAGGWETRAGPGAADRQDRGRHGHQPARPGPRDRLEPDRRRPAGRAIRRRRDPAR